MEPVNMREVAGNFINYMITNLIFPLEDQEHIVIVEEDKEDVIISRDVDWCLDWWIIEVAKYFFEGEEAYMRYPMARRLEGSQSFNKTKIAEAAKNRTFTIKNLEDSNYNNLVIYENCRGFNTVLAKTIKNWGRVYVRIQNQFPEVVNKTIEYFDKFHKDVIVIDSNEAVEGGYIVMSVDGFSGGGK